MELANRRLAEQLQASEARHAEQMNQLLEEIRDLRGRLEPSESTMGSASARSSAPSADAGRNAEGRPGPVPSYTLSNIRAEPKAALNANFGPGFELISDDGEYMLQVHQETQVDYRAFDPNGEVFAHDGFVFPRARIFFNGRTTKPIEYMISFNRGFGGLDLLDAFINVRYDDRVQFKIGRFMTPFNYEQFAIQNMWLIAPERSLFTSNLGLNRMLGAMFWGTVLDQRADYAIGVFDGPRNSYEDFNDAKDIMGYVNTRPFLRDDNEGFLLRDLNIGGSFAYGVQDNPLVPRSLRTASNASNAGTADRVAPPFLVFNNAVTETGQRGMWSAHVAYFYKQLSLLADYNGANISHAINDRASTTILVPVHGYSLSAGYFLTGETVQRRTVVDPIHDFDLRAGKRGLGAVELIARYSTLDLDPVVFPTGLADPNLWSNHAWITNLGVNWYWNKYVKIYIDWEHAEFGDPVFYAPPGKLALTNEVFWFRFQFFF
jgi:phosphate-selective porin OprO/OprP